MKRWNNVHMFTKLENSHNNGKLRNNNEFITKVLLDVVNLDVWSWFPISIYITYLTLDFPNILQFKRIKGRWHGSGQSNWLNRQSGATQSSPQPNPYRATDIGKERSDSMWKYFIVILLEYRCEVTVVLAVTNI